MSEKEGVSSDDGNVPLKQAFGDSNADKKSTSKKNKKGPKKDNPAVTEEESTSATENEKTERSKQKKKFYVEVMEEEYDKVPLLDQPSVVEGSRQRRTVTQFNAKPKGLKPGAISIPNGKGLPLKRIPAVSARFKRLRLDEIKLLHRFMFGKLGDVNNLNSNILKFCGFPFTNDSPEYAKKLVVLGKSGISILREFLLLFDLNLKIKKKEDVVRAILDFLLCPKVSEVTANPNIVSHPKRKATKRNYCESEIREDPKRTKKTKPNKTKENESTAENGETDESTPGKIKDKDKAEDEETKENNSGADNTNELKKPAKKRKRNQVIEEQPETSEESRPKRNKNKEIPSENTTNNEKEAEINPTENLSDEDLKTFLKKVLADANLEKTTMKTVYSLISKHYPNYNFTKKKDFIKEVVKSAIQT